MNGPSKAPGGPVAAPLLDPKAWAGLQARAALAGLQLFRSHPGDGRQRVLLEHRGLIRQVGLDELEAVVVTTAQGAP